MHQLTQLLQAAAAIDSFKMESPAKKLDFGAADKENRPVDEAALDQTDASKTTVPEVKKDDAVAKPAVAATIKAEEADEPLLQENPQRFVLFPIKYHEVCVTRP